MPVQCIFSVAQTVESGARRKSPTRGEKLDGVVPAEGNGVMKPPNGLALSEKRHGTLVDTCMTGVHHVSNRETRTVTFGWHKAREISSARKATL